MKNNFNNYFWNGSGYVFHSKNGIKSAVVDDRSGAWAVLAGMADDTKKPLVLTTLKNKYNACPYQEMYIEEAMLLLDPTETLKRMRSRYSFMINSWSSTLWEHFNTTMSNNHAWSAGPLYHLGSSILGVRPLKPAYAEYAFLPLMGDLIKMSGVVPSPKGNISVSCTIANDTSAIIQELNSPVNSVCIIGIPKHLLGRSVTYLKVKIGTDIIWQNGSATGNVAGVDFYGEDSQYIKFKVQPGNWVFTSESKESATALLSTKTQGIQAFPNFTNETVNVQFADGSKNASIKIIDMAGHTVYNKAKISVKQGDERQVDISDYSNGTYVLIVNDIYRQKIIKTGIANK